MSRIRGTDTGPEIVLRRALWNLGFRHRRRKGLPGRPDLTFSGARVAIFVDGCFWHGCAEHLIWPKNNALFWKQKIRQNIVRDRAISSTLRRDGWSVIRIWEHDIRN